MDHPKGNIQKLTAKASALPLFGVLSFPYADDGAVGRYIAMVWATPAHKRWSIDLASSHYTTPPTGAGFQLHAFDRCLDISAAAAALAHVVAEIERQVRDTLGLHSPREAGGADAMVLAQATAPPAYAGSLRVSK